MQGHGATLREASQDNAFAGDAALDFTLYQGLDLLLRLADALGVFLAHQISDKDIVPRTHGHAAIYGHRLYGGMREYKPNIEIVQTQLGNDRHKIIAISTQAM